jgi:hypothetical protein
VIVVRVEVYELPPEIWHIIEKKSDSTVHIPVLRMSVIQKIEELSARLVEKE